MFHRELLRLAFAVLIAWPATLPAQPQEQTRTTLPEAAARVLAQRKLPESAVSAFVQRVGAESPLLAFNADVPRNPASVAKLLTTFAALLNLGPTYQWRTEAYADGNLRNGTLTGDLILKGYGDPYLVTERLWLLERELRRKGLRNIDGDIVIDNSWFAREELDPGAFDGQPYRAYNALPDALLVNFQAVNFIFRPDPQRGRVDILADPALANVEIRNNMRVFSGSCGSAKSGISMVVGTNSPDPRVTFSGALAGNCPEYQLLRAVLDGPTFAYGAFRALWEEQGGTITGRLRLGQVPAGKTPFLTFLSPPLAEVIRPLNKYSNNVMTRQIFLTLGAEQLGPPGTLEKGGQALRLALGKRGLDFPELRVDNGAGLSRENRISAESLGRLLLSANDGPFQSEFKASLSIAGLDGTTRRRFQKDPMAGQMHLKTGTLNGVTAIAGYVRSQSGPEYVVVVIVNQAKATWGGGQEVQNAILRWAYQR